MNAHCTEITRDGYLRDVDVPTGLQRDEGDDRSLWIALAGETTEIIDWLQAFGLQPRLLEILRDREHAARFLPLEDAVFFEYPLLREQGVAESGAVSLICLDRLVLEIRQGTTGQPTPPEHPGTRVTDLTEPSTSGLVCAFLVAQSAEVRGSSLALGARARALAAGIDDAPDNVTLDEIVDLKAGIRDLDALIDEQLAMLTLLKAVQSPLLDLARVASLFQVAVGNTESSDRAVGRLTSMASDLQGQYDAHQQRKTNQRLAVLTILSAIFLPLTLIAGVYGMNFDVMPELHFPYAYPIALAAMALIAGALAWFFWSRGWMDEG